LVRNRTTIKLTRDCGHEQTSTAELVYKALMPETRHYWWALVVATRTRGGLDSVIDRGAEMRVPLLVWHRSDDHTRPRSLTVWTNPRKDSTDSDPSSNRPNQVSNVYAALLPILEPSLRSAHVPQNCVRKAEPALVTSLKG
jgi:hypothetical protein